MNITREVLGTLGEKASQCHRYVSCLKASGHPKTGRKKKKVTKVSPKSSLPSSHMSHSQILCLIREADQVIKALPGSIVETEQRKWGCVRD